jgi:hypothetical protein
MLAPRPDMLGADNAADRQPKLSHVYQVRFNPKGEGEVIL